MTEQDLTGRVALVTGASRGIGRGIARRLAASGAHVFVSARSLTSAVDHEGTLEETVDLIRARGGEATAIGADLALARQRDGLVPRVVREAGRLDILVNNAGLARFSKIADMPADVLESTLDHYIRAPIKLAQAAIPVMRRQTKGWIVNIGSATAFHPRKPYDAFATEGGSHLYGAMKAALNRLTRGLAAELLADGIAVNLVAPSSAIRTPGADAYIGDWPTERMEYLTECVYEMCRLPAKERTGLLAYSLHYVRQMGLRPLDLDTGEVLPWPQEMPVNAHPDIPERAED
mgnify:CR=1 FL=1